MDMEMKSINETYLRQLHTGLHAREFAILTAKALGELDVNYVNLTDNVTRVMGKLAVLNALVKVRQTFNAGTLRNTPGGMFVWEIKKMATHDERKILFRRRKSHKPQQSFADRLVALTGDMANVWI